MGKKAEKPAEVEPQETEGQRRQRVIACHQQIQQALQVHGCRLQVVEMKVDGKQLPPSVQVVAME